MPGLPGRSLMTLRLPDHAEGTILVQWPADTPMPQLLSAGLSFPMRKLMFRHAPHHWLMDLTRVTDTRSVLVCRECQLRVPVPIRADVPMDLFLLLVNWHLTHGPASYEAYFNLTDKNFTRYFNEWYPSPQRLAQRRAEQATHEREQLAEARAHECASDEGMPEPPR